MMVSARVALPGSLPTRAQDGTQTPPHKAIEAAEGSRVGVFEILKPAVEGRIEVRNDGGEAAASHPWGFLADPIPPYVRIDVVSRRESVCEPEGAKVE